jgi:hypothetical protein
VYAQDDRRYRTFGPAPARRIIIAASALSAANITRVRGALIPRHALLPGWLCGEAGRATDLIAPLTQQEHICLAADATIGDGGRVSPWQRDLPWRWAARSGTYAIP